MKFKKGDRVKINCSGNCHHEESNREGKISKIDEPDKKLPYHVRYKGETWWHHEECLSLLSPTLEDMPESTPLISSLDTEAKVLAVIKPGLYVTNINGNGDAEIWTAEALENKTWKIKDSDTVDIEVEGKTKTISRQSAKELNLID